jgi:hypothetical protein
VSSNQHLDEPPRVLVRGLTARVRSSRRPALAGPCRVPPALASSSGLAGRVRRTRYRGDWRALWPRAGRRGRGRRERVCATAPRPPPAPVSVARPPSARAQRAGNLTTSHWWRAGARRLAWCSPTRKAGPSARDYHVWTRSPTRSVGRGSGCNGARARSWSSVGARSRPRAKRYAGPPLGRDRSPPGVIHCREELPRGRRPGRAARISAGRITRGPAPGAPSSRSPASTRRTGDQPRRTSLPHV